MYSNQPVFFQNFLPPESLDEITNTLHTIKQYREYQSPNPETWREYIKEIFQLLGFTLEEINPRLCTLNVLGSNHKPEAVLILVNPGENFDEIVPGLAWDSYCFLATQYYKVNWGIITDDIQLKVLDYQETDKLQPIYFPDIDHVICHEQINTFCSIYKVFSYIKEEKVKKAESGTQTKEAKQDHQDQFYFSLKRFWTQLLEKAKSKTQLHAHISPGSKPDIGTSTGIRGLYFKYILGREGARVELYIDREDVVWNKQTFNSLLQHKTEIEALFGSPLNWESLPNRRASCIRYIVSVYSFKDHDHWDHLQDQMIDAMIRLEAAFRQYINKIGN